MRINSKDILFGQPILKIREVIRKAMHESLSGDKQSDITEKVANILKQPNSIAKTVLKQLIQEDYLILNKVKFRNIYHYTLTETDKGRRLGIARAAPPITRQKADQLLNELIERVKAINANEDLVYFVESIKVFGSYLSDKEILGDLDVGVKLSRKFEMNTYRQCWEQRIKLAKLKGRRFNNYSEELFWPKREVFLMLKSRQRGLSIHDEDDDEVFAVTETKMVFQNSKNNH